MDPLFAELLRSLGAAGALVVFLLVTGVLVPGKVYERMERRYDDLRVQREAEQRKLIEELVPMMTRGIEAMTRFTELKNRER